MMGFGMIGGMLIFWIVLIGLAVLFAHGLFQSNQIRNRISTNEHLSARQILEQRYARGEINQDQFRFFSLCLSRNLLLMKSTIDWQGLILQKMEIKDILYLE